MLDLPAIKKRCEAATDLTMWAITAREDGFCVGNGRGHNVAPHIRNQTDAEFFAHARADLLAALEALEEAQGGWNAAAAELARHDCNVGEFGCSAPDSKGPCTKHQLAEAQGRIGAIREAAELAPEVAIATILAILGESE